MADAHGLTVRWSLAGAPDDTLERLKEYVRDSSHARFSGLDGLRFKTWRARAGEWFEGCYVFATDADRDLFQASFTADADDSPVSQVVGSGPALIEPCEVVAVAEGSDGFLAAASYEVI
ncbi:MAG: hypothetical protein ACRDO8_07350 [Nocardioidaceae bacterium]